MATFYQSAVALNKSPAAYPHGSEILEQRAVIPLNVALAVNDILEMCVLPQGCVPLEAMLESDDLDSGTTLVADVGFLSGDVGVPSLSRAVGQQFFAATAAPRTAGTVTVSTNVKALFAKDISRSIGVKITAAPAGFTPDTTALNSRGLWGKNTAYSAGDAVFLPDGRRARCSTAGISGLADPFVGMELKGATVNDGTAVWTVVDAFLALSVQYRAARNGV